MRYIWLTFLFFQMSFAFAQSFKEQIETHRNAYKADFIKETRSPLQKEDLKNLHFFEPDSTYHVLATVKILENEKIFKMPTYDGTSKDFIRYAQVNFSLNGNLYQMVLYKNIALMNDQIYKDYLFLPFTDESNNVTTYGGGRYIDLNINDIKNDSVVIDFNKAYNPYCAYSDGYRCPIPPEENDLAVKINAGEMKFTGEKKHKL